MCKGYLVFVFSVGFAALFKTSSGGVLYQLERVIETLRCSCDMGRTEVVVGWFGHRLSRTAVGRQVRSGVTCWHLKILHGYRDRRRNRALDAAPEVRSGF